MIKEIILTEKDFVNSENIYLFDGNPAWKDVKPYSYSDIINSNPPPIKNILEPWLPEQGIAFIYAATGVGKTLFTLNIAYAIACGGNFLKFKVPIPKRVLYVDGEMAFYQIYQRFTNIVEQQGEIDFPENFYLLNPKHFPNQIMPLINTPEGQIFYKDILEKYQVDIIVFDNLSSLCSIDENVSEQWSAIQNYFISLRAQGKSVIVVHHAGKDKKGYRGSSRMLDIADTAISLQEIDKNETEAENTDSKKFKIVYQKSRTFGGKDALEFEVTLSRAGWEFQSLEKSTTQRIVEMLKFKMSHKEIAIELGFTRSYISRLVRKALKDGLIRDDN